MSPLLHQELTVGSLFSGIGGFDLGLERTGGFRTSWFCEQDEFCQRVLARRFPGVPIHPDITELHHPPYVDVLCGGFPCQDLSTAGLGAGLAGARSGLWSEYARLIGEVGPRYVVVENVSALLARGFGTVLADLAALGFDAEWDCIPASAVGAPHRRDRVWLVAYPNGEGQLQQGGPEREERRRPGNSGSEVAHTDEERRDGRTGEQWPRRRLELADGSGSMGDPEGDGRGPGRARGPFAAGAGEPEPVGSLQDADSLAVQPWRVGGRAAQAGGPEWWAVEPPVGRVAHGVPNRLDQLAALGNALIPQIPEWIGHRILAHEEGVNRAAA